MKSKRITVLVDSRERRALFFPKAIEWHENRGAAPHSVSILTKEKTLWAGDYALLNHEELAIVERKRGPGELATNLLTDDRTRAWAAFRKLSDTCEHPYVLIESTPAQMFAPNRHYEPTRMLDAFFELTTQLRLRIIWAGLCHTQRARYRVGELVVRLLMAHVYHRPSVSPSMRDLFKKTSGIVMSDDIVLDNLRGLQRVPHKRKEKSDGYKV